MISPHLKITRLLARVDADLAALLRRAWMPLNRHEGDNGAVTWVQSLLTMGDQLKPRAMAEMSTSPKFVTYYNEAGLGNRMYMYAIAWSYAKLTGRTLLHCWPKNRHCFTTFEELFANPNPTSDVKQNTRTIRILDGTEHDNIAGIPKDYPEDLIIFSGWYGYSKNCAHDAPFFEYCGDLAIPSLQDLRPNEEIMNLIAHYENRFQIDKNTIAIHVRRGDFRVSNFWRIKYCQRTPITFFAQTLDQYRGYKYFLASDSNSLEIVDFCKKYKINKIRGDFSRQSYEGMKYALVDAYLMSKCRLLIASVSAFSSFAGYLGNIKIINGTDRKGGNFA